MIKMRKLQLRTISLILTLTILAGCVYSSAAADAVTSDHVDRQNGNLVERVYDSGNVTLSNRVKAENNRIFTINLNVKINNIAKLPSQADAVSSDTGSSTVASPVSSAAESTASSAPVSSTTESAATSAPASSNTTNSTVSASTSSAAESAAATTSSAPAAEVQPSAARTMKALAVAEPQQAVVEPQPEPTYEVRYYIQPGFEVVDAVLEDGQYVSWPNLTAKGVNGFSFSTDLKVQAVATQDGLNASAVNTEDQSGVYQDGKLKYSFASLNSLLDETKPAITWSRSKETSSREFKTNVADTNWTWSTAGDIGISLTDPTKIWDAGTSNQYYDKYTNKPGYSSATWKHIGNDMNLRRFRGTFTLPADFKSTDTVQYRSVNQAQYSNINGGNVIPINDDIFIFCYPAGTTLTDRTYLKYLAFWSGTSGPRDGRYADKDPTKNLGVTFHDRIGNQSHNTDDSLDRMKLTDGWYVDADLNNIGKALFKNDPSPAGMNYVIDIFTQEYADGGGMDQPEIVIKHNRASVLAYDDNYQTMSGVAAPLNILNNDTVSTDTTPVPSLQIDTSTLTGDGDTTLEKSGTGYKVKQNSAEIGTLTVNSNGSGTFTPTNGFTGTVQFNYTAFCDYYNTRYSDNALVTIQVDAFKGQLNISKTITAKYPAPDTVNAAQSFVFKIQRYGTLADLNSQTNPETSYEVITLSGNTLTGNKTITGLRKGYYSVTEQTGDAWRYIQTTVVVNGNSVTSAPGAAVTTYLGTAANSAKVDFINTLTKGQWLGDTTVAVNTIQQ